MAKEKKVFVGQKVWHLGFRSIAPEETTITKVGLKYFEIDKSRGKYDLESLRQVSESSNYAGQVYLTLQEILDKKEKEELESKLKKAFSSFHKLPFTVDQMRRLVAIIEETEA